MNTLRCSVCRREDVPCVVFVNACAELSSVCATCLALALREAARELGAVGGGGHTCSSPPRERREK